MASSGLDIASLVEGISSFISNNEPVSDLNRLTKKEKRIKEKKKINKLIDKQNFENKKLKLEIGNMKGLKKLLKERKEYEKKEEKKEKKK